MLSFPEEGGERDVEKPMEESQISIPEPQPGELLMQIQYKTSNYLHQKSSNYSSTFTGLIISGGWPGSPHGYIRTAAEGLSSIETFVESGKPNCSVPDLPLGELSTQSSHENSTPAQIVGLLVHY